ncbi:RNA-binding protein 47-like [Orussus abietinus]|uniref:RNA-binding protein 47-like n=1 Tax=Orussus abietinus TaxID=222816 RepID=UPI000626969E|nr:RNA-binding protein 47-like [Orussus abietinus]
MGNLGNEMGDRRRVSVVQDDEGRSWYDQRKDLPQRPTRRGVSRARSDQGSEHSRRGSLDTPKSRIPTLEEQMETSKLVLQLVTDSKFTMTQVNGQRKLGPPPGWTGPPPGPDCEVFVGKIPRTLYEHEIYPIFQAVGDIYEIRLMMDFSGANRGYCFVMFSNREHAKRAIRELDNFEIRPGRRIGVVASINNCRLCLGQLPGNVETETVVKEVYSITDEVAKVAVYRNSNGQARYALISYRTHRGAAMARRRLVPDRGCLIKGAEVSIDWAHPDMMPINVVS